MLDAKAYVTAWHGIEEQAVRNAEHRRQAQEHQQRSLARQADARTWWGSLTARRGR